MQRQPGLTTQGLNVPHTLNIVLSIAMIGVGLYLTNHYFEVNFPMGGLEGGSSFCDISKFWNCDTATFSKMSNIAGIPIAFFSVMLGLSLFAGSIFNSNEFERTNKFLILFNSIGCVVLFFYSLLFLGSLCPFCTAYYALSFINFFLFFKFGLKEWFKPSFKILSILGVITLVGAYFVFNHQKDLSKKQETLSKSIIDQYYTLNKIGNPQPASPFNILKSTENFEDAPIQISVFSDFQCPFCKKVAEQMEKVAKRFQGRANIKYYFFPLDSECNRKMTTPMHPFACKASYIAVCSKDKFVETHDDIFKNQENLNENWINQKIKGMNIGECFANSETINAVKATVEAGLNQNIESTPTMIINGVKIEGYLPTIQLINLLEDIATKNKK
jgi:protein-disulfide isomerase/uncharacterized membrane protein